MSTNLPKTIPDLLNWAGAHVTLWQANQASIGLSSSQVTQFKSLADAMIAANTAAEMVRINSKDATLSLQVAVDTFRATAGAFVTVVKAFADSTHNMTVYTLAGVSPDAGPSVLPPPNAPDKFTAGVNTDGTITINWKVSQPEGVTGVVYDIFRRYNTTTGAFTWVGSGDKKKSFTDKTLPVGVDSVQYYIQPKRGTEVGPQSNIFSLQFGSVEAGGGGGGGDGFGITSQSVSGGDAGMKMAA